MNGTSNNTGRLFTLKTTIGLKESGFLVKPKCYLFKVVNPFFRGEFLGILTGYCHTFFGFHNTSN